MTRAPTWCVAATVKAPLVDVQNFAAHHIDRGATKVFLFLDDADHSACEILNKHPAVRAQACDDAWWASFNRPRPDDHKGRQAFNATRAYRIFARKLDWFAHIDVDEFIWPDTTISESLAAAPSDARTLRLRPIEALEGDGTAFKGRITGKPDVTKEISDRIYPAYGQFLRGGFISHTAGKLFVRTGFDKIKIRIHNIMIDNVKDRTGIEATDMRLCHAHAKTWDAFKSMYEFRMKQGSYRKELSGPDGVPLHAIFKTLEDELGEAGLRGFYNEICVDTPQLRKALAAEGLLHICDLRLDQMRKKHFPD